LAIDAQKVFKSTLKIAESNTIMNPSLGTAVANNYKDMFAVEHVHNDEM
jgi:hypothetical protein